MPDEELERFREQITAFVVRQLPHRAGELQHDLDGVENHPEQIREVCLHWAAAAVLHGHPITLQERDLLDAALGDEPAPPTPDEPVHAAIARGEAPSS